MMCERPKIHVFLGAPPPRREVKVRPSADFKHLTLTWQDGHLQPAAGEADQERPRAECSTDACRSGGPNRHPEEETDSACEYLDSCFPAERQAGSSAKPAVAHLSEETQFLSTWTLSQALMLRAKLGSQAAASLEKPPPSQTPPKDAQTPSSVSSSTPELFSPLPLSIEASAELFTQPFLPPRMEQGAVVIEATPDGMLCSQEAVQAPLISRQSPDCKKTKMAENVVGEASEAASDDKKVAEIRCPITLLVRCDSEGAVFTVLVAVVHPCHLKEVQVSGNACITPPSHQGVLCCSDPLTGKMFNAADQVWTSGGDVCPFGICCRD